MLWASHNKGFITPLSVKEAHLVISFELIRWVVKLKLSTKEIFYKNRLTCKMFCNPLGSFLNFIVQKSK